MKRPAAAAAAVPPAVAAPMAPQTGAKGNGRSRYGADLRARKLAAMRAVPYGEACASGAATAAISSDDALKVARAAPPLPNGHAQRRLALEGSKKAAKGSCKRPHADAAPASAVRQSGGVGKHRGKNNTRKGKGKRAAAGGASVPLKTYRNAIASRAYYHANKKAITDGKSKDAAKEVAQKAYREANTEPRT